MNKPQIKESVLVFLKKIEVDPKINLGHLISALGIIGSIFGFGFKYLDYQKKNNDLIEISNRIEQESLTLKKESEARLNFQNTISDISLQSSKQTKALAEVLNKGFKVSTELRVRGNQIQSISSIVKTRLETFEISKEKKQKY